MSLSAVSNAKHNPGSFIVLCGLAALLAAPATAAVLYVTPAGGGGCTSWADACSLQSALGSAGSGDEIWVEQGLYKPGAAATDTFNIPPGVAVYGGFAGTESTRDARDWRANVTILSGDIGGDDTNTDGNHIDETTADIQGTNSNNVVTMDGTKGTSIVATTALDGFTITGGVANGSFPATGGGGLLCNAFNEGECSPTLADLTFAGNEASDVGGAVYLLGHAAVSSPTFTNVTFQGNAAPSGGGGAVWVDGTGGGVSSPTFTNVTFWGNSCSDAGGAVYDDGSSGTSSPVFVNVTFSNNSASGSGGAMYSNGSTGTCNPSLTNVIMWGDTAGSGNEMFASSASVTINYSLIATDPLFGSFGDNGGGIATVALLPGSPAIDAGDDASCPPTDERGVTRPQGQRCDIGAFEFEQATVPAVSPAGLTLLALLLAAVGLTVLVKRA